MKNFDKKQLFQDPEEGREKLLRKLQGEISGCPVVAFAYVYGSFPEARPYSDIDIGVYFAQSAEDSPQDLALRLGASLSRKLSRPVDLRPLNSAPIGFLYHVFRGRLLIDREEDLRVRLVEKVIMQYLDMKPLMQRSLREAMTRS